MDSKSNFAKKKNRRSVLNSARRNLPNVDETNNYQLADALAKTRVELSKTHKEKFQYVSQNLKYMETITQLKDENKKLRIRLAERESEFLNVQKQLKGHKNSIQQLNRSFDNLNVTLEGFVAPDSAAIFSPQSLVSSFDSGMNSSSLDSSSEHHKPLVESAPLATKQLFLPEFTPDAEITLTTTPKKEWNNNQENIETPRIPKTPVTDIPIQTVKRRQKRKYPEVTIKEQCYEPQDSPPVDILLETPQIINRKPAYSKKRETPSRSAKLAIKSLVEPKLSGKLRQGDPSSFLMK